ncbi:26S protease regulatory subunit [Histoplasma capsulatum G186AR]|uniref:26S proteasome regulatory subunit 4 homolog n=1 Tax=Ajellomyces capsulatus (strain G186AR / H82 / ATCC MYA-2454 / RMSCC 2432) TaxID=447093 RepID=C0NDN0_AJECG|nr:26S protease regulatory subunit [Histoplasma capsulatum G186AR]EEH10328.1 26S protease regulatory subunit [Histoplasma capsulatum G186AR]
MAKLRGDVESSKKKKKRKRKRKKNGKKKRQKCFGTAVDALPWKNDRAEGLIGIAWLLHYCLPRKPNLKKYNFVQTNPNSFSSLPPPYPYSGACPNYLYLEGYVFTNSAFFPPFLRFIVLSSTQKEEGNYSLPRSNLSNLSLPQWSGNQQSNMGGGGPGDGQDEKDKKKEKPKYEPPPQPTTRIGRRKRKQAGPNASAKLPAIYPTSRCKLKYLRMQPSTTIYYSKRNIDDFETTDRNADERNRVDDMRGSPMGVGNLEEMIDDDHAIVSTATGPEYYVSIMSFVDKDLLEPGASILLHHKSVSVVGVLTDDADPLVSVMKLDKAPTESYADIGGLESQIQEVREAVELPLLHPELYEEMGIKPPKGVILYGGPGTGKTLLAKAVANQTSATFLRIVGSELIQKYLGDGPRLVRQIFQVAAEHAPSIVFIDEIDAIGTKRYESTSGGEREVQRTMLELLNQLDGFDDRGDVKVIMATNKIESLDPALIRPGRIDRKILFENPDQNTKKKIFTLHTSKMSLGDDVDLDEFINQKDDLSGADIKAICSEAGLMALRERRMRVQMADFRTARERVLKTKSEGEPEGLYL